MKKINKIITISVKDKVLLYLEAAKSGISLKRYIEDLVRVNARNVRGGVVELVDEGSVIVVDEGKLLADLEEELPVLRAVNEMQPISVDFSLDKSGIFKSVEPKIYSNGRCFEVRRLGIGQGVVKSYFRSLLLARGSLLDSTTEKGKED